MNAPLKLRDYPIGCVWIGEQRDVRVAVSVEPRPEEDGHLYWRPSIFLESSDPGPTMPSLFAGELPGLTAKALSTLLEEAWELARSLPEIPVAEDDEPTPEIRHLREPGGES